jgi:hypothetical protein
MRSLRECGGSPAGVLSHHLEDQIPNFFRCLSSAGGLADLRNHPPVPTESGVAPSDNGFRRDDEECLFPARPVSENEQPEEPVEQM